MKSYCLLPWLICVLLTGCSSSGLAAVRPKMEVEISNQSSQALDNALVNFGDYQCKWGHVGKTFSASYMYYPYPVTAAAELHWDEDGKHRMEKLDLSKVYQRGKSGRLTFTVYDGRVEVSFVERK
jgi:hypothetical protein